MGLTDQRWPRAVGQRAPAGHPKARGRRQRRPAAPQAPLL